MTDNGELIEALRKSGHEPVAISLGYLVKDKLNRYVQEENEIIDFLNSTEFSCPFDDFIFKSYLSDKVKDKTKKIYFHIKVLDREKNLIQIECYHYSSSTPFTMLASGVFKIGKTTDSFKKAILKSKNTTSYNRLAFSNLDEVSMRLPVALGSFIYTWYKCIRNRKTEIREVTGRAKKETESGKKEKEYLEITNQNKRRVISLGGTTYIYTTDSEIVKNIKHRNVTWHMDAFERRGSTCKYHRKDGTILLYERKSCIVRPKKGKDKENVPVTYVIK